MGRVRVKICGICNVDDARAAVEAGADAIGLIFADSPRQVSPETARRIVEALPAWVSTVGVFVNTGTDEILSVARQVGLTTVQLHGDELPCAVKAVGAEFKVVRAFRIADAADVNAALDYLDLCRPDACLLDAKVSGSYGGTGVVAPWQLLAEARSSMWPLILGGGLTALNVAQAIDIVQPYGVDTSSGVEREPGKKDHQALRAFVDAASQKRIQSPVPGGTP